jgi:hypothetical protein
VLVPSSGWRLLLLAAVGGGVVGVVVWLAMDKGADASVRPWLVIALSMSAALLFAVPVRAAVLLDRSGASRPDSDPYETSTTKRNDKERGGLERFEWLIGVAMREPSRFDHVLRTRLCTLTDQRLRTKYGLDSRTDPNRAREIVGESLWRLMMAPVQTPPRRAQVEEWVATIERL